MGAVVTVSMTLKDFSLTRNVSGGETQKSVYDIGLEFQLFFMGSKCHGEVVLEREGVRVSVNCWGWWCFSHFFSNF